MFWSKNMRMETITAGRLAPHLAHTGVSIRFTTQGLGVVGTICVGRERYSRLMPYLAASQPHTAVQLMIETVGPKSATVSLTLLVNHLEVLRPESFMAKAQVATADITERRAAPPPTEPVNTSPTMFFRASTTKITEINPAKISSVNLVRYLITRLLVEVSAQSSRMPLVQRPTQA